ncbi:MAG TPA: serine/threonine-protein kinase [Candidatus Acidoferrales bacterium]|nr:serine/threonine-protein kinase [Candidatus Acidoferrales bacterium]
MSAPSVLGSYTILEPLRRSGYTETYLAEHTIMRAQRVVLRVLRPEAPPEFVESFQATARRSAKLHHDCIASVIDLQRDQDRVFTVLEYVAGRDLAQLREARGTPPPDVAAALMYDVFRGLEHAHGHDLRHGRLRPRLIRVSDEGKLKILGFGVETDATVVGVPAEELAHEEHYRSPEQRSGAPEDARTDLYSAGVIFFELLAGHLPFAALPGEGDAADARVPPPLRAGNPTLPAPLAALIEQLLADRRDARPANARVVRTRLEEILETLHVTSGPDVVRRFLFPADATALLARPALHGPAGAPDPVLETLVALPPARRTAAEVSGSGPAATPTGAPAAVPPARAGAGAPPGGARRRGGVVWIAAAVVALVVIAGAAWFVMRGRPHGANAGSGGAGETMASLDVSSDPPGASITLIERNETRAANALFERLAPGAYHLRAEFPGLGTRETLVTLAAGAEGSLEMRYPGAAPAEACTLYVLASPRADEVTIDDDSAEGSDSLFWMPVAPGHHRVTAIAAGFETKHARVDVRSGEHNQFAIVLAPAAATAPAPEVAPAAPAAPGPVATAPASTSGEASGGVTLHVDVTPASDVWVDHALRHSGVRAADLNLSPDAKHTIELRNPDFATWTKTLSVRAGEHPKPIRFDFTEGDGGISVRASRGDVTIWIDGRSTGQSPPAVIRDLKPGRRRVELRTRDGATVVSTRDVIVENSSENQPVVF